MVTVQVSQATRRIFMQAVGSGSDLYVDLSGRLRPLPAFFGPPAQHSPLQGPECSCLIDTTANVGESKIAYCMLQKALK